MAGWLPDGLRLFEHLRDQEAPLRLENLPDYVRSLGLSPDVIPCRTFQGTPMRHRSVHVGNFFLGDKQGGEAFTDEDEEILVLFASQAATAVANARTHRNEQRARADLEALVETSPVGVVMFDAQTGTPVRLPVIFVSGYGRDETIVRALEAGAVEYLDIPRTDRKGPIGTLTTKTLLISGEGGRQEGDGGFITTPDGRRGALLRAYDKATGADAGAVYMPAPQTGTPMTYRQYLRPCISRSCRPGSTIC